MFARFKRIYLLLLLSLTGLAAMAMGLAVFRSSRSPEALDWAVKGTLAFGVLLLLSFAAFTALDKRPLRELAAFGLFLAAVMLLVLPVYIAWEITDGLSMHALNVAAHHRLQRVVAGGVLTAGLFCLIPFVLIPRMKRVARIVQYTAILYFIAAYLGTLLRLTQQNVQHVEEAVVTLLIPAATCMFGVYVLHKFFEVRDAESLATLSAVVVECPRCHEHQTLCVGRSRCAQCRLRFSISVEEPTCPNCSFNLHNLTHPRCPECGLHLDDEDVPVLPRLDPLSA